MKTLEKIETFLVLAECRSFNETAKRLYCSQPTISNHIHQLEEQYETRLFHRSGKMIRLTKQGEIFLVYAKQVKQLLELAALKMKQEERRDLLPLYVSNYIASYFFTDILKSFHCSFPEQQLEVHTFCYEDLKRSLTEGRTNFAFMPIYPEDDEIREHYDCRVLFEDEFPLIIPPGHPLDGRKVIYGRDLRHETILLPRSHYLQQYVAAELERQGVQVRFLQMSNFEMIKQAVKSRLGIAFLPRTAVLTEIQHNELAAGHVPSLTIRRSNGLVKRKDSELSPAGQRFCQHVEAYFNERCGTLAIG